MKYTNFAAHLRSDDMKGFRLHWEFGGPHHRYFMAGESKKAIQKRIEQVCGSPMDSTSLKQLDAVFKWANDRL